jgi:alkylhydroperoxidase family enzyme
MGEQYRLGGRTGDLADHLIVGPAQALAILTLAESDRMGLLLGRLRQVIRGGPRSVTACVLLVMVLGVVGMLVLWAVVPNPGPQSPPDDVTNPDAGPQSPYQERFPLLSDAQTWKRLPPPDSGGGEPLPDWARILANPLPRTTAALLELDALHRSRGPLPPVLRARLRWEAAHANHCPCAEATALADLRRAGVSEDELRSLAEVQKSLPPRERAALAFTRKLTRAASSITDAEVSHLLKLYGEEQVVALVLLVAHANFQDRLLLALGVPPGEGAALPPLTGRFTKEPPGPRQELPPLRTSDGPNKPRKPGVELEPERDGLDFFELQANLEKQRSRRARIALPPSEPGQINWGLVCRTYQPERATAWSKCGYAYDVETDQDPVLNHSLFWIVTHSEGCFY